MMSNQSKIVPMKQYMLPRFLVTLMFLVVCTLSWAFYEDGISYSINAQTNPTGPSTGSYRVVRGGSWSLSARFCRVSYRNSSAPGGRSSSFGLRLAL